MSAPIPTDTTPNAPPSRTPTSTCGWLSNADPRTTEQTIAVPITLNGGVNQVKRLKGTGYAELDTWKLINQYSGKPLNLNGPNNANGSFLSQWTDSGYWNQWLSFATP